MSVEQSFRLSARLLVGLFVIALGVIFLLDNLRLIYAGDLLRFFWPALFLVIGVVKLVVRGSTFHRVLGLAFTLIGLWLLLEELDVLPYYFDLDDLWPLILVALGLALVFGAFRRNGSGRWQMSDPTVHAFALMAGNHVTSTSRELRGGSLGAVMGGCELDLRGAEPGEGGAVIDAFALWGGVEIWVPEGWSVTSQVFPLMGAFEDKTRPGGAEEAGKHLTIKGFAVMGGIEVNNGPAPEADRG